MEAAEPITPMKPSEFDDEEQKMKDAKTFNIEFNNEKYKFEFGKSENNKKIIFKISKDCNIISDYFILILKEEDFQNLNPIFKIYQNIGEIFSLLIDILNDKKYSLTEKNKSIVLTMKFNIYKGKEIDIEFNLREKKAKKEDMINNLYSLVKNLMEENKIIEEELNKKSNEHKNEIIKLKEELNLNNNQLKNEITKLKEELKNKDKEILNIKKELEEIKKQMKKEGNTNINPNFFKESIIIQKLEEKLNLISWVSEKGKIKDIKLLYRGTRDGDNYNAFYNRCSNQGPTLSLIKTKNGRKFGGFSFAELTDKKGILRLKDINAFLFSLDNIKKYNIIKPELAIGCYSDHSSFLTYGNNADCLRYLS